MSRALALLLLVGTPALGQASAEWVADPGFVSEFSPRVSVSGRTLVGVLTTGSIQPPEGVGLQTGSFALPRSPSIAASVCVRATTQDGRYFAQGSFKLAGGTDADYSDRRANVAWPQKYAKEVLHEVNLREVAAVMRNGSCESTEVVPVIVDQPADAGSIQVLVNTRGSTVTATLRDPNANRTLRRTNCVRVDGSARVAFDARCVLVAADLPRRATLRLEQVSHDGLQTEVLESVTLLLNP